MSADVESASSASAATAMPELSMPDGLYFDEVAKLRLLAPETHEATTHLRDDCKDFSERVGQFQDIVGGFVEMLSTLSAAVEKEKLRAISSRNQLKTVSKQRQAEQQLLQALIAERQAHLERLRLQHESLLRVQQEREQFVDSLVEQK
eukprot:m.36026 g.36026  ORF g.36026 m.36026 type:complete len:148 (+) comp11364_c0_seq1:158-601(+)